MAKKKEPPKVSVTPEGRVSFHSFFEKTSYKGSKASYQGTMIWDEGATAPIEKVVQEAAEKEWGDDIPRKWEHPLRDGGEKSLDGYGDGKVFARFKNQFDKPKIVGPKKEEIELDAVYNGMWAKFSYHAYAYDDPKPGVALILHNVQKVRDDEPFGGAATDPDDDFDAIDDDDLLG